MKHLAALLLAALLLLVPAFAEDYDYREAMRDYLDQTSAGDLPSLLPDETRERMEEARVGDILGAAENLTPQGLLRSLRQWVKEEITQPARMLATLVGVILLCALLDAFGSSLLHGGTAAVFGVVVSVFVSAVVIDPVIACVQSASEVIVSFSYFLTTFIPIFAGVMTASGQPLTAAAYNIFLFWMCQTSSEVISGVFMPLLCAHLALAVVSVVCPEMKLEAVVSGIRSFVVWALTLLLTLFVGLLSLQSAVASGGDTVAVRTTKFFISSLIPVVGKTLSDLFSAAQGSIQLIKSTLGAFGVLGAIFTFLPAIVKVGAWYASVYLGSLAADILGTANVGKLLRSVSATLGIILAVLVFYALLVVISTTLMIVAFKGG